MGIESANFDKIREEEGLSPIKVSPPEPTLEGPDTPVYSSMPPQDTKESTPGMDPTMETVRTMAPTPLHQRMFDPQPGDGDEPEDPMSALPRGKGLTMLNHLFKRGMRKAVKKDKKPKKNPFNIYTDQVEALKAALGALGLYSDRNPGGMPVDLKDAKQLWFGEDEEVDQIKESEWRSKIERADNALDPKKIRRFVNYDGSMTWEVLNDDRTVMSRFTLGEYRGKKVFAQGGYSKFADLLKKLSSESGPDNKEGFEQVRKMFGGQ